MRDVIIELPLSGHQMLKVNLALKFSEHAGTKERFCLDFMEYSSRHLPAQS